MQISWKSNMLQVALAMGLDQRRRPSREIGQRDIQSKNAAIAAIAVMHGTRFLPLLRLDQSVPGGRAI